MVITSVENPVVKLATKLAASKKERSEQGLFLIEGLRLCLDAVESGIRIRYVFITTGASEKYYNMLKPLTVSGALVYEVSESVFAKVCDTKTPQGVLCVCEMLDKKTQLDKINTNGLYIGLEHIQDPGNLGTILRTAEAVGLSGVVLSADCCDILNPKVIRATMGGVFRLPVFEVPSSIEACRKLSGMGLKTYAAVVDEGADDITSLTFPQGSIVFIGNEGNGLTKELAEACDYRLTIRMRGRAESLNAAMAAGIIMWEMARGQE